MSTASESFQPLVAPSESPPELTLRALVLGAILGIVFGAASTYLALRVGLTTSASVPIAVLAAWAIRRKNNQRAVLEHNIVQTTGSAGESVAAAVVFTVPALIFLGYPMQIGVTTLVALTGGALGVLMMVPLRRYLIVKEHGQLRYPEGKACAEIIHAGERGGTSARKVFVGLGLGALFKAFQALLGGVPITITHSFTRFKGAVAACDFAPELVGVGYILGYRTSTIMVAGSLLASFILIPMIALFGAGLEAPLAPAAKLISSMSPGEIWGNYVRHIGAGAVAAGGLFALARALPSIVSAIRSSLGTLLGGAGAGSSLRTERDTPTQVLLLGSLAIVGFVWAVPIFHMNLLGALLILVLGFVFAVVCSRITGEVGSTSCPLSGMTIGVLMATCGIFIAIGWEGSGYSRLALMVGAIVCIAISNAGTCSQDLKTGFLLGATPVKQQGALLIGVLTSVLAVGWTAYLMNEAFSKETPVAAAFQVEPALLAEREDKASKTDGVPYAYVRLGRTDLPADAPEGTYLVERASGTARFLREDGIGRAEGGLQAPQAKLMSVVIDGLLTHQLPWPLILLGVAIAIFVELLGARSLTFAVGVYLPLSSTMPVFLGGIVRWIADRRYKRVPDADDEPEGTLFSSGIIAGAAILGILAAGLAFDEARYDANLSLHKTIAVLRDFAFAQSSLVGALLLALLGFLMFRGAAPAKKG